MNFINIVIHPGVPHSEPQKVLDLVAFARKFLAEFPVPGEKAFARMEPWANTDDRFALVIGITVDVGTSNAPHEQRRAALEKFAEDHYPHFFKSYVVVAPEFTPATFPAQELG